MDAGQSAYWLLGPPESERRLARWAKGEVDLSTRNCPVNPAHTRVGDRSPQLSVVLPTPPAQQLVWTWHAELLIQEMVATMLLEEGFGTFELRNAKARFPCGISEAPTFSEFIVKGWGGIARPESGIELTEHCEQCGRTKYSGLTHPERLMDPVQWDGSDIFIVWPLPKFIFITDRVRQFLLASKLKDMMITPIEKLGFLSDGFSVDMSDCAREKAGYPWSAGDKK
jgi:hypothetical protein